MNSVISFTGHISLLDAACLTVLYLASLWIRKHIK